MVNKHIVLGKMVNASVVTLTEGSLVIDSSVNLDGAQELLNEAGKHGEIIYLVNTHEHGDHLAGNHLFNCPIISSAMAREAMLQFSTPPALPTLVFSDQLDLYLSEHVLIKHVGGHCPGSAVVYFPERKLLFSGDLVFVGRVPYMGQAHFRTWLDVLSQLECWEVENVVPGHGPQGGKELLTRQREWLEQYISDVLNWSRNMSPQEVFDKVLSRHPVAEGWQPMLKKSIELVASEFN